ncbi:hypothetical protein ACH347_42970 [Saccharopolyspora sp. 5N102]
MIFEADGSRCRIRTDPDGCCKAYETWIGQVAAAGEPVAATSTPSATPR